MPVKTEAECITHRLQPQGTPDPPGQAPWWEWAGLSGAPLAQTRELPLLWVPTPGVSW